MKEQLMAILNTMNQVETKGQSTMYMAACIQNVQMLIQQCEMQEQQAAASPETPQE